MANASALKIYYTGGGSNSTLSASIGGAKSSAQVGSQTLTTTTPISGVTLVSGAGNAPGAGTLSFNATTKAFSWQPYLGSVGTPVVVAANGDYFIQGAGISGGIIITVVFASLPSANTTISVTAANVLNAFFADNTKDEAYTGVNKYHCFFVANTDSTELVKALKMYMYQNTPGADQLLIGLDSTAAGNGASGPTAVANETTAPSGITFVNPASATDSSALNLGDLSAGQGRFVWVKQEIPANTLVATPVNTAIFGFSFLI